ncbi:hypothetical protein H2248_002772 [Termitomyces sp. 'cryptogamus']|nr:hypothetical protein H2248_002772 [Termitomyces sp. 'cryptogamus']
MNGFQTLKPGGDQYSTIHLDDLEIFLRNGDITITEDELKDRSKGDWFSKSLLLLQVTWFILQILVRRVQHLAITELEIATLAFAILNFATYIFWWNKPFDVGCPIIIPAHDESGTRDMSSPSLQDRLTPEVRSSSKQTPDVNLIVGRDLPPSHLQFESTPSNSQSSKECDDNIKSNGHDDVTHLNASQSLESSESFEDQASNSAKDNGYTSNGPAITMSPPLSIPNQVILHGPDTHPHDVSNTDLPSEVHGPAEFHEKPLLDSFNPLGDEFNLQSYHEKLCVHFLSCGAAVVFGVIHCLAWHFEFPSKTEQLLWRVSSTATSCFPIVILIFGETALWLRPVNSPRSLVFLRMGCTVIYQISMCLYPLARLFLLVEMFVVLRKPNSGIFTSVDWIDNIPHI